MKKIVFCDTNSALVSKVETLFKKFEYNKWSIELAVENGDIFEAQKKHGGQIVTASNPSFSMGGGLDAQIAIKFPEEVKSPSEFKVTEHLFFTVTVDEHIKASEVIVERALSGIFGYAAYGRTMILTGLGTAIGGLSEDKFLEKLEKVLSADLRSADLSSANLRSADLSSADLRSANLSYANLSYANLRSADLSSADLRSANLRSADLSSANLRSANLRSADLSYANLRSADLSSADLRSANLSYANLSYANLSYANLRSADLSSANLSYANLSYANLRSANLSYANLSYANLSSANLSYANLSYANLSYANLRSANLRSADLSSANLRSAKETNTVYIGEGTCFFALQCPEEGAFTAWKKCANDTIVKLLIPAKAKRSSATSRKCRASEAKVVAVFDKDGNKLKETISSYDSKFKYVVGETVKPTEAWDDDRWNECSTGIHFFITRMEAEQYI